MQNKISVYKLKWKLETITKRNSDLRELKTVKMKNKFMGTTKGKILKKQQKSQ